LLKLSLQTRRSNLVKAQTPPRERDRHASARLALTNSARVSVPALMIMRKRPCYASKIPRCPRNDILARIGIVVHAVGKSV
jgi:hypothetical protein